MEEQKEIELTRAKKNIILFRVYFLTSLFTFTGGIAMLSTLKREICDRYKLMPEKEFYDYAAISQTLPGVIAVTNACFVGKKINGYMGMFIAALSAILPAFVFMLLATILFNLLPKTGPIYYGLSAVRAISVAFIFSAALTIAKLNLKNPINIILAAAAFIALIFNFLGALDFILIAIGVGLILSFSKRKEKKQK